MKGSRNVWNDFLTAAKRRTILGLLPIITFVLGFGGSVVAQTGPSIAVKNVVLVHGGFVDATVGEAKGSHAVYVSHPKDVATLIEKAAQGGVRK